MYESINAETKELEDGASPRIQWFAPKIKIYGFQTAFRTSDSLVVVIKYLGLGDL